jgi:hypothetical protein
MDNQAKLQTPEPVGVQKGGPRHCKPRDLRWLKVSFKDVWSAAAFGVSKEYLECEDNCQGGLCRWHRQKFLTTSGGIGRTAEESTRLMRAMKAKVMMKRLSCILIDG